MNKKQEEYIEDSCFSLDEYQEFNDYLDDYYDEIDICGNRYLASEALKEVDPTSYDQELCNFCDRQLSDNEWIEINGSYYYTRDVEKALETLEEEEEASEDYLANES